MKKTPFSFSRVLYTVMIFLLGMSIAFYSVNKQHTTPNSYDKLRDLIYYIDHYYVDSVNHDQLSEDAILGILEHLDPHSTYSDAEENKAQTEHLEGAFEGIGVQFNIMNDTIMVVAALAGGPSEKAGIKAGDRIIFVNGEPVAAIGITNEQVFKMLKGKKGTQVKIGILRPEISGILEFEIIRGIIPTHTVPSAYMLNEHTGYIKIDQFGAHTAEEFTEALYKLIAKGMQKLVLDLRGNVGGYLDAALQITDHFLDRDELILSIKGLHAKQEKYYATGKGIFKKGELTVLIDEISASASEILAGAIQDNDRGTIMGRRSFGKGLVQRPFDFADGSQVRLTVSRYYTPSGRCIQRDYQKGNAAYYDELLQRIINDEDTVTMTADTIPATEYRTKSGRIVYGGGGITPDIIVLHEKRIHSNEFYQALNHTALIQFAFNYTNQNKTALTNKYPSAETFIKKMYVTEDILQEYLRFYAQKSARNLPFLNKEESKALSTWLKAFIGRNLYQDEAFYPIINTMDEVIKKSIRI
ncbi:MAG: S41 family peptidase [Bacteroidetes bacterium]|nr:S41 family peptidase [Bacteroidota bacterium]MCL1968462.1 S41 family peptidase [Bacteroidota bacterium]